MVATSPIMSKSPINARQQAWIRALDRARLVSTHKPTYSPSRDSYRVYSAHAEKEYHVYPVELDGHLTYECDCKAGERGLVCWHAALIAALPGECSRRARHREAQRQAVNAKSGHALLMECFE